METNRKRFNTAREEQVEQGEVREHFQEPEGNTGVELSSENEIPHERKKHHEHHHIGKYRSFSNYSSASNQPSTNTGPGLF